jgi:branched-chain amino acid transport system ATP-binding protein
VLEVSDIKAGYGLVQILRGVSLRVAEREFVALVGGNGAGKTTLMKTIAGLIAPQS